MRPKEDYRREFGDWKTNGLGHKYIDWGTVRGVLMPGRRVWKVKRARVVTPEIRETVDDGSFQLGPGQLEEAMEDMHAGFIPDQAVGQVMFSFNSSAGQSSGAPAVVPPAVVAPRLLGSRDICSNQPHRSLIWKFWLFSEPCMGAAPLLFSVFWGPDEISFRHDGAWRHAV